MRILSLDGGGYLGLSTAAFLEEAERHFGTTCYEKFDFFCGTSAGAIVALGLAAGKPASEIRELFLDLGSKVFRNPFPGMRGYRFLRSFLTSRYSNKPLRKALETAFGGETLKDVRDNHQKYVLVPSFCLTTGRPRVFKNDYGPLTAHGEYTLADVALASASAPVYFPVARLRNPNHNFLEDFCDGGIFANNPALMALTDAIHYLNAPVNEIRILSISTPREYRKEYRSAHALLKYFFLRRGALLWSQSLANLFVDGTAFTNHTILKWLVESVPGLHDVEYARFEFEKPPKAGLDRVSQVITEDLIRIGTDKAQDGESRRRLSRFFT